MMREAAVIKDGEIVNVIVLPKGKPGDALLSDTCVEITKLEPKPGIGLGWSYIDGSFFPPVVPPPTHEDIEVARRDRYQNETDGMFFDAMRSANPDLDAWITAVEQIKADLPYPTAP